MILEICWLTEASFANVTLVRPGAVVNIHVRLEIAGCREGFGAQMALVRLLLVVGHSVVVKV